MRLISNKIRRHFQVGLTGQIQLEDCGSIYLEPDEQITFRTEDAHEYDVVRKSWGYYATPSLNRRLVRFGLHAALINNKEKYYFVVLVDDEKRGEFDTYLIEERLHLVTWLDSDLRLDQLYDDITKHHGT